jgi:hypothetical protein
MLNARVFSDIPVTRIELPYTVIEALALKPPSTVVTVIVAVPVVTPVTTPEVLTEATEGLLEVQVTLWLVAFEGEMYAVRVSGVPIMTFAWVMFSDTPITFTLLTVIVDVAVKPPSAVLTVIVAVPTETADISPAELTVATALLLEDQVTDWFAAFAGVTTA